MAQIQSSQSLPSQANQKDFQVPKNKFRFIALTVKIVLILILLFILIQTVLFLKSYFSRYPDERICWSDNMCKNYCLYDWQPTCVVSESPIITDRAEQFKYVITGKKNVLEAYNPNQKYCVCNDTSPEKKSREQLYDFYQKNK